MREKTEKLMQEAKRVLKGAVSQTDALPQVSSGQERPGKLWAAALLIDLLSG
ncbi:MAG: hypothetical protein ACE5L7_01815 [Candidatus Aminicenantales bacterium]